MPGLERLSITDRTLVTHQGFQSGIQAVSDNCKELLQVAKQFGLVPIIGVYDGPIGT